MEMEGLGQVYPKRISVEDGFFAEAPGGQYIAGKTHKISDLRSQISSVDVKADMDGLGPDPALGALVTLDGDRGAEALFEQGVIMREAVYGAQSREAAWGRKMRVGLEAKAGIAPDNPVLVHDAQCGIEPGVLKAGVEADAAVELPAPDSHGAADRGADETKRLRGQELDGISHVSKEVKNRPGVATVQGGVVDDGLDITRIGDLADTIADHGIDVVDVIVALENHWGLDVVEDPLANRLQDVDLFGMGQESQVGRGLAVVVEFGLIDANDRIEKQSGGFAHGSGAAAAGDHDLDFCFHRCWSLLLR